MEKCEASISETSTFFIDQHFPPLYIPPNMAKRPTPKKRLSNDRSGNRYASYLRKQWRKLRGQLNSPYAGYYREEKSGEKALKKITKIKA